MSLVQYLQVQFTEMVAFVEKPIKGRSQGVDETKRAFRANNEFVLVSQWIRSYMLKKDFTIGGFANGFQYRIGADIGGGTTTLIIEYKGGEFNGKVFMYKNDWKTNTENITIPPTMINGPNVAFAGEKDNTVRNFDGSMVSAQDMVDQQNIILKGLIREHLEAVEMFSDLLQQQYFAATLKKQTGKARSHYEGADYLKYAVSDLPAARAAVQKTQRALWTIPSTDNLKQVNEFQAELIHTQMWVTLCQARILKEVSRVQAALTTAFATIIVR